MSLRTIIFLLLAALTGCTGNDSQFIARVGDETLTNDELPFPADSTIAGNTLQRNAFISTWVNNTVLYKAAEREGILSTEEFQKRQKEFQQQMAIHLYLQKEVYLPEDTIADENKIRDYFKIRSKEFISSDTKIQLNGVFFQQRNEANKFRSDIIRGKSWKQATEVLQKNAVNVKTVENVLYTRQTIPSQELWNVALTLRSTDVSFPVPTPGGFAIIKVVSLQEKGAPSRIEFVWDEIRQRLIIEARRTRYEKLMEELRSKYDVEIR